MNRFLSIVWTAAALAATLTAQALSAAADIPVAVSIKPIHALVASVMEGMGEPGLIVSGGTSPHTFSLKPADAAMLQNAKVVFWVGREMETYLEKPLEALPTDAKIVSLIGGKGLELLAVREGNGFEPDDDEGAGGRGETDPHVWLDPRNAAVMVDTIAATLAEADPGNGARYAANAAAAKRKLAALEAEIAPQLAPLGDRRFIVFHDAYQYFEKRFGLAAAGAITIHPENPPGAKAIRAIRERLRSAGVRCVFSEPQFDARLVNVVIEGTDARTGVIDAEAGTLEPGPGLYEQLLRNLAKSLKDCLS